MRLVPPSPAGLAEAAACLRAGGCVAHPAETMYGLAVDPWNEAALDQLYTLKGRDRSRPVLLLIAAPGCLDALVRPLSPAARACVEAFWPGPLSLVLARAPAGPVHVADPADRLCVRCPASDVARALCQAFGGPITSTSANRSGQAPARTPAAIDLTGVDVTLDTGPCAPGPPSTVYDPETGQVLREGAVSREALCEVLRRAGLPGNVGAP